MSQPVLVKEDDLLSFSLHHLEDIIRVDTIIQLIIRLELKELAEKTLKSLDILFLLIFSSSSYAVFTSATNRLSFSFMGLLIFYPQSLVRCFSSSLGEHDPAFFRKRTRAPFLNLDILVVIGEITCMHRF